MIWLRKGFIHILATLLFISLVGGVAAISFSQNFSSPDNLKAWLSESKIYDQIIDSALTQTQQDSSKQGGAGSVSLDDPAVKQAAEKNFTPGLLEHSVNTFLDSNYDWLKGKTGIPQFNIDLSGVKASFATQVGQAVTVRLTSLPVCTPAQLAQIQLPVDPLSVSCRPPTLDPKTEGARVAQEIISGDFLDQPNLTADTVGRDKKDPNAKPYYQTSSKAPHYFQLALKLPLIFSAVAVLTTAGILTIAPTRRKGWRRVGVVLAEAGVVLVASKFAADTLVHKITDKISDGSLQQIKQPREDLIHKIESHLFQFNMVAGLVMLALAVAIFFYLFKTRGGASKPQPQEQPAAAEQPSKPEPPQPANDVSQPPAKRTTSTAPPLKNSDQVPRIKSNKGKQPPLVQG